MRSPVWATEMNFLLRVSGLTLRNRVQSLDIRERLGVGVEPLFLRTERSQLKWFGYLVRMPPGRLLVVGRTGKRPRGRNMTRWMNYYILDIGIISLGWPGNEEEVAREKDILVSLACCHHDPVPGLVVENAMVKVWEKHPNCSVFGCTDEHRTLFRVPASEETREQWIYWFIYDYAAATQI